MLLFLITISISKLKKKRFSDILSAIYNEAKEAYSAVFGKELTMPLFETF